MKSEWIEAVIGINEEALLKLLHENHIQLIQKLLDINIHSSFSLNPIRDLIGYAKLQQDKNSLVCKELVKKLDWQYYRISHYSFSNFEVHRFTAYVIFNFVSQTSNFKFQTIDFQFSDFQVFMFQISDFRLQIFSF
jgi:phage pi2 protein 07